MRTDVRIVVHTSTVLGLLPLLCLGQAIVVRQTELEGGNVILGVSGAAQVREAPDPDVARERKVLDVRRRLLNRKREAIEDRVFLIPEVPEALAAATEAAAAYYAALAQNQAYAELRKQKERLLQERRELWTSGAGVDKAKRLAKQKDLAQRLSAVDGKIAAFPDSLPVFRALKKRKAQAFAAFLEVYNAELDEFPEWQALGEQLDDLSAWARDFNEQQQTQRTFGKGK